MDDERLKQMGGGNYWKELLDRIRDIRSSEMAASARYNRVFIFCYHSCHYLHYPPDEQRVLASGDSTFSLENMPLSAK